MCIKIFRSTVALKQRQADNHFAEECVQIGTELQEERTMKKEHKVEKYVMYLEY